MHRFDFPIVVLAAGQSSRMRGTDKLLELVNGTPLIRVVVERALSATRAPVLVALPALPALRHQRQVALAGLDVQCVAVERAQDGMGASLAAAVAALPAHSTAVMVVLADMPDVTAQDLCALAAQVAFDAGHVIWRAATAAGTGGHPVVFHHSLFEHLTQLKADRGGQDILQAHKNQVKLVPLSGDQARVDLDTPEDWDAWRRSNQHEPSTCPKPDGFA